MKITMGDLEELGTWLDEIEKDGAVLKVVERGPWIQYNKEQKARIIFTDGKKHYCGYITREGSPFGTEYEISYSAFRAIEKGESV